MVLNLFFGIALFLNFGFQGYDAMEKKQDVIILYTVQVPTSSINHQAKVLVSSTDPDYSAAVKFFLSKPDAILIPYSN